jgi:hypothetical protein
MIALTCRPSGTPRRRRKIIAHRWFKALGQYGITVNDVSPGFMETIRDPETHPELTPERTEEIIRTCSAVTSRATNAPPRHGLRPAPSTGKAGPKKKSKSVGQAARRFRTTR